MRTAEEIKKQQDWWIQQADFSEGNHEVRAKALGWICALQWVLNEHPGGGEG